MQEKIKENCGWILTALIGVLPVFMLSVGYSSEIYYLIIIVSMVICFFRSDGFTATKADWLRYRGLAIALFSMMFVVLISMMLEQVMLGAALERSLRIAGGVFLLLGACLSLRPELLRQAVWGLGLASLIAGLICWWLTVPTFIRPDVPQYNAVSYGNLLLMVVTVTAFSLGWKLTSYPRMEKCIKGLMIAIGFSGFILTQTRSGWLATPVFIIFAVLLFKDKHSSKKLVIASLVSFMALFAIFASNKTLTNRAQLAISEFESCLKNPLAYDNTCVRIQLWRGSWELFKENPLLGTRGGHHFNEKLRPLIDRNIIDKKVVDQGFGEPHNDLLYMMASYGSLGLISLLLIYFAPALIFGRRLLQNQSQDIRVASAMGLCICFGFLISGMTETMFRGMRTMSFYAVTIAWLLALSDPLFVDHQRSVAIQK